MVDVVRSADKGPEHPDPPPLKPKAIALLPPVSILCRVDGGSSQHTTFESEVAMTSTVVLKMPF